MTKKFLNVFGIILIALFLVGVIFTYRLSHRAIPKYDGEFHIPGLQAPVKVYRDSFAIPHIYADSQHDLYLTTGYIMAQERLWQMDLLRRVTLGRLSEIFGEDFVQTDLLLRALNYSRKSKEMLQSIDPEISVALNAFAEGINRYIEDNENRLPPEFAILNYTPEPWEPYQSLNLIGYIAWDLKAGWSEVILEKLRPVLDSARYFDLIPDISHRDEVIFSKENKINTQAIALLKANQPLEKLGLDVFSASNNWAVSPGRSVYNKPILANDMHLSFNVPGIWIQMHQVVEGELNVTGVALPGQPFIISGHNENIAWGMTNTYVDNLDLYEEKVSPDSSKYLYQDVWHPIREEMETIHIKGGDSIVLFNRFTHRGPIVSGFKGFGQTISMHWTGDEKGNELRTVFLLNRAKNWTDFKDAVKSFVAISQNINYADIQGNIGLYASAGVPIRKRTEGLLILPGWTDEYDWQGLVPFEELPHEYNPGSGYVLSANNKTIDNSYPYHIGSWYTLPHRFNRIEELLKAHDELSIENFKQIQTDNYSKLAEEFMPAILSALGEKVGSFTKTESVATTILMEWDRRMTANDPAPLIFEMLYQQIIESTFKDEMDSTYYEFIGHSKLPKVALNDIWYYNSPWWDNVDTQDKREEKYDIIQSAFKDVIEKLVKEFGSEVVKWNWQSKHTLTLQHPLGKVKALDVVFRLNRNNIPVGGSFHTIAPYGYDFNNLFDVNHGASQRHIYLVGDWDKSLSVIPTGVSGVPSNKHYLDQTMLYVQNQYHPDWFSKDKVIENAKYEATYTDN